MVANQTLSEQSTSQPAHMLYAGLDVLILGLARQGMSAARFLLANGANVTVSDLRSAEALANASRELESFAKQRAPEKSKSLRFALGGHPLALLDRCDLICLSGGVAPDVEIVREAQRRGVPLVNDGELTLRHCPVPVIGITGSAGKTTTTTLTGLMLEASGFRVHVGGNIGTPLLDRLDSVVAGDRVVMEFSSFQLQHCKRSPAIAGLINITPNHLDRHRSMSEYAGAKTNVLRFQQPGDTCVLNADDTYMGPWLASGRCEVSAGEGQPAIYFPLQADRLGFSLESEVQAGAFLDAGRLVWRRAGEGDCEVCESEEVRLRGRHNLANILAACCLAGAAGASQEAMRKVATTFGGVEHRLEIVRRRAGVTWVNDSIATAPERTVAALRSFTEPLVVLLGGRDKHLPWADCVAELHKPEHKEAAHIRRVILFGEAADLIGAAIAEYERLYGLPSLAVTHCTTLAEAVALAANAAIAGDVVLLSPGGTSFDAYEDFAARGSHFRALVEALP